MIISATNKKIGELMVDLTSGKLKPQPDFQRRLVWSNSDKVKFIQTILEGFPFPEIFLADGELDTASAESTTWLVDGQQRISTIHQYFTASSDLKLPSNILPYEKLSKDEKKKFLSYVVVVRDLGTVTLPEVKEVFRRINSTSYDLNAMEINNASYNGPLKKLADKILKDEFFKKHDIFSANDVKRMQDTLFILSVLITCMSDYFSSDTEVEAYLQRFNNSFTQGKKWEGEFRGTLSIIEKMGFPEDSRVWKKADFFTLLVEVHRKTFKLSKSIGIKTTAQRLQNFYDDVDEASRLIRAKGKKTSKALGKAGEYYDSAAQGTVSKKNRENRGEIIRELLK